VPGSTERESSPAGQYVGMAGRAEKFQHCGTRSNLSVPSGLPGKDVEQSHVAELVNQPV